MMWNLSVCLDCGKPISTENQRTRPRRYCEFCMKKRKTEAVRAFNRRKKGE